MGINNMDMDFSVPIEKYVYKNNQIKSWADYMDIVDNIMSYIKVKMYYIKKICVNIEIKNYSCKYNKRTCFILKMRSKISLLKMSPIYYYKHTTKKTYYEQQTYFISTKKCYGNENVLITSCYMDEYKRNEDKKIRYIAYMSGAYVVKTEDLDLTNEEKYIHSIAKSAISCTYCTRLNKVCRKHKEKMKLVMNFYSRQNLLNEIYFLFK